MDKLVINYAFKNLDTQVTAADPNKKTLERYNKYADEYVKKTIPTIEESHPAMRQWIDSALELIGKEATIFEIGSATLRDAGYMRTKGHRVICSDATESFINLMNTKGEKAIHFNVLEDRLVDKYSMFFANGVFPHFTLHETHLALQNIYDSLIPNGILAFSVKQGHGEEWVKEKLEDSVFAYYWDQEGITQVLREEGYKLLFASSNQGVYPSHKWLNLICRKIN